MSIFIDKNTRLLIQGITGRDGSFHARQMIEDGTQEAVIAASRAMYARPRAEIGAEAFMKLREEEAARPARKTSQKGETAPSPTAPPPAEPPIPESKPDPEKKGDAALRSAGLKLSRD